jgi:hypothetical protein
MRSLIHIGYREVAHDVETVNFDSPEIDNSLSGVFYTALGSLAMVGTSDIMHRIEFDPGFKIIGQHIGVVETLAAMSIAGAIYGANKLVGSIQAIRQHIQDSRLEHSSDLSENQPTSRSLVVELG